MIACVMIMGICLWENIDKDFPHMTFELLILSVVYSQLMWILSNMTE